MSLVGDIILELRSRIPDAPAVCNPPLIESATGTHVVGGGFPPSSPFVVGATLSTPWGESTSAGTVTGTMGPSDNAIAVTLGVFTGIPTQITGINIYAALGDFGSPSILTTGTAGVQTFPPINGNAQYILGVGGSPAQHSLMPTRNTAFLPDTDGQFIGGYMCYRLLNRALQEMVKIAGGMVDVTGVQSQVNQSMYRLNAPFYTFTNAWFDGYPMDVVQRAQMYLRNSAAGFSGILSYEQDGPQQTIQVWPQSNRTGGQANLLGQVEATASAFVVGAGGNKFLSIGLCQIDDEIMAYSQVQTVTLSSGAMAYQFNGVLRGMGGTDAVDHIPGSIVTELNIRLSGYRMARTYNVGDSNLVIQVPQAWETPLVLHMLSQVRSMEQDDAAAKSLQGDFVQMAEKIAKGSRMGRIKPRQIPIWGQNTSDARNVNGIGFGWLIN